MTEDIEFQQLNQDAGFLASLIKHLPGYIYRVKNDKDYTPMYISEQVERITGYTQAEYLVSGTISCGKEIHEEDTERVWNVVQEAIARRQDYQCEYRIITKQGQTKWVSENGRGIFDEHNQLLYLEGFVMDITNQKEIAQNLHENQLFAETLIDSLPVMLFVKEARNLSFVSLNKAGEELIGYSRDTLIGKNDYDFFPKQEADFFTQKDREVLNAGKLVDIPEETIQTRFGERILHTRKVPIIDAEGKPKYLLGISEDITEKKRNEKLLLIKGEELSAAEEELRANLEELKIVNHQLAKSEHSLTIAQKIAQLGSWEFNLQTFELYWSKETYQIFELENCPLNELFLAYRNRIPLEEQARLDEIIQKAQIKGDSFTYYHRILLEDGRTKFIKGIGEVLFDRYDQPAILRGSVQDITEQKKIEFTLQKEQARFQDLVDSVEGIVWEMDYATHACTYVSQKALRLLGYPLERWYEPDFWATHVHLEDRAWATAYSDAKTEAMESHEFEYRFIAQNGRIVWLRDIISVIVEEGKPTYLRGIMIDITTSKKMEEDLLIKDIALSSSINGIAMAGVDGKIFYTNRSFADMWGYTKVQDIIGMTPMDLVAKPEEVFEVIGMLQTGGSWVGELQGKRLDGSVFVFELAANMVKDKAGKPLCMFGSFLDITARKEAEGKIYQQNEVLKNVAFTESHILRRPLASILGLYNLIQMAKQEQNLEDLYEYLEHLRTCVMEADDVIHQIVTQVNEVE